MNGARYFGGGGPNASWDGDDAGGGEQQHPSDIRGYNNNNNNNNNNRKNNSWSVQPELSSRGTPNPYYPPQFNRRASIETGLNTLHSGSTVKHNNSNSNNNNNNATRRGRSADKLENQGYDTDVSNNAPAHHIRRNSDDTGASRPRSSSYEANNTARIIAERKRRSSSAEMGMNHRPIRRVSTAGDLNAMARKRQLSMNAGIQQQNAGRPMRRVNTAGDLHMLDGQRAIARNRRPSWNGNMQMPPGQATGRPIIRNSSAGDPRAVEEHAIFRGSNVSDIHDEFTDTHQQYKPVSTRRRNPSNTSNRSNEDIYPSGVAGRRRTIGDRNSRRRSSRTSSGKRSSYDNNPQSGSASDIIDCEEGSNDFHQQLEQLRVKHRQRQAQQQQQSPHRRSSSMSGSLNSIDLEHEMAIMSAPLGVGLSTYAQNPNQQNPNQEMGELFRKMQQLEMKSVDKSQNSWYLGRDASRDPSHHGSDLGPLGASHHSNKYSAKGSAYSAVGSAVASDRTNDERLFHALLNGKGRGNGKLRWHEKHSLSKRTIFIAVGLIVMAVAILGVVLLLSPTDGSKKDGSGVSVPKNATNPSASVNYVVEPPSDIAGRCSPSNLPGSIPACLEACYPASCCYIMSDSGNKCWDINDPKSIKACKQYRPYCDIFHDPWDGATDGVLRTPPLNLVPICQQINGKSEEGSSRLRGRGLLVGTADDMCEQYCEASKCCKAATISHPYAAGLELSASGVYTDAITKDYVVTNCQDDLVYQKNRNLCAEYDKFCMWEDVEETQKSEAWTSRPTMDPASSMTPSISPSILPSTSPSFSPEPSSTPTVNVFNMDWSRPTTMSPSTSFSPSQQFKPSSQPSLSSMPTIPIANITVIEDVCSGADNIALLANGNEAARAKCLDACTDGLCCYTEQLGYDSFIESCNAGNEAICEGYKACLWLQQSGTLSLETLPDTSINATINSTTTSNVTITNFDLPAINTSLFFNETSVTNTSTIINDSAVTQATNSSALSNETIIFNLQNPMTSEDTSSSPNLSVVNDSIQTNTTASDTVPAALIPPPPSDLAALCALNGRFCGEVCKDVSCCFETTNNCSAIDDDVCRAYAPCSVLYQQGT
ncbi:hypothetical protein ACHAWC_008759 [Mediolabrus comicus]